MDKEEDLEAGGDQLVEIHREASFGSLDGLSADLLGEWSVDLLDVWSVDSPGGLTVG
jgi:hypothetical protein